MKKPARIAFVAPVRTAHVVGRHRLRFLNAMTSMGLMKVEAGDARFATMSTAAGKHIGQMRIEVGADALTLVAPAESFERLLEGLKKHKVADDIRWTPAAEALPVLGVWGADAQVLGALALPEGLEPPGPGRWRDIAFPWANGVTVRISAYEGVYSELGEAAFYLRCDGVDASGADVVLAEAIRRLNGAGAVALSPETFATQSIAALWPDDNRDLPEEEPTLASTRLVAAVDWNKGCFLGQEVFVMARDRGEAPKRLVALRGAGAVPETGAEIHTAAGQVAGRIGNVAADGAEGFVALGLLKRRFATAQDLALADGRPVVPATA